jgi:hypothetical protein
MRLIKLCIMVTCVAITSTLFACTSDTKEKQILTSENLALASKLEVLNTRIFELNHEIADLNSKNKELASETEGNKERISELETTLDLVDQSAIDDNVLNSIENILQELALGEGKIEMFSAEVEHIEMEKSDGMRYFIFSVNRHRPGWGWEASMGEEAEGYPIKDKIRGRINLVYKYKQYSDAPVILVNELEGNRGTLNFLLIDSKVVFVVEHSGP